MIEDSWLTFSLSLSIVLSFVISTSIIYNNCPILKKKTYLSGRVLFVTAHPDDECMFFGPSVLNAVENGRSVHLLCLSTGDYYGKGNERITELIQSCKELGVPPKNVTIIDDKALPDGPASKWDSDIVGQYILDAIRQHGVATVVTFDDFGVSGHTNHRAVHVAIQKLLDTESLGNEGVRYVYVLESTNKLRKYVGVIDVLVSMVTSRYVVTTGFKGHFKIMRGMMAHRSQLCWFRKLYIIFSRYLHVNTHQCIYEKK